MLYNQDIRYFLILSLLLLGEGPVIRPIGKTGLTDFAKSEGDLWGQAPSEFPLLRRAATVVLRPLESLHVFIYIGQP